MNTSFLFSGLQFYQQNEKKKVAGGGSNTSKVTSSSNILKFPQEEGKETSLTGGGQGENEGV